MATLIFDIETIGESWADLDDLTRSSLTRWIDRTIRDEPGRQSAVKDLMEGLGFSPLTGMVVAIGVYDPERGQGVVYYTGDSALPDEAIGAFTYKQRSEAEMLQEFWDGALYYDTFVTFNGRSFDAPFLVHRSLINGLIPSRNLLEGRYPSQQRTVRHIDLQDEMTFFGAMHRRPNLHLFCRAYGVKSPKGEISGDDVAELFRDKKFRDIARYNARDVIATAELYEKWRPLRERFQSSPDLAD